MDTFLEYRIHRSLLRVLISLWRERERERERESLIFLSGEDSIGEFDSARVRILCAEFLGTFFFSFRRRTEIQRRGDRWNSTCDFISRFDSLFRGREREREKRNGLKNPLRRKESIEFSMLDANRRSRDEYSSFTKTKNKTAKESFPNDYYSKKYN